MLTSSNIKTCINQFKPPKTAQQNSLISNNILFKYFTDDSVTESDSDDESIPDLDDNPEPTTTTADSNATPQVTSTAGQQVPSIPDMSEVKYLDCAQFLLPYQHKTLQNDLLVIYFTVGFLTN